jgi:multidrug efflux system membrane fusion protein
MDAGAQRMSEPAKTVGRRWLWTLALLLLLGGGGYYGRRWYAGHQGSDQSQTAQQKSPAPAPVQAAKAEVADVPIYLVGLGTVQAFNTVTVRSRVDGEIQKIAFQEGQVVQTGDLLAQIDPRPFQAVLDQAKAKLAQDHAQLANSKRDLARYTELAQRSFAPQQQLETQQALVNQQSALIQGDQAAIDSAQTQLDYTTIRAPITGRTGFRLVDQGNIVHASDQNGIVQIAQLQPIAVIYTAPEQDLPAIKKAPAAGPVKVWALTSDGKTTLGEGLLSLINNEVDAASGTIRLKATFENKDSALWPGLSVDVRTLVRTLKSVVTVPDNAVQRGPKGLYAFVIKPDNTVEMRPLTVGATSKGRSVVEAGLAAGERVITAGQYRLQPGTAVALDDHQSTPNGEGPQAQEAPDRAPSQQAATASQGTQPERSEAKPEQNRPAADQAAQPPSHVARAPGQQAAPSGHGPPRRTANRAKREQMP